MKLVYTAGILAALSLASCAKGSTETPAPAASASASASAPGSDGLGPLVGERRTTKLDIVPATIRPLLPKRGIYASGAGSAAKPWRVIVDLSAGTVTTAKGFLVGGLPFIPKMDQESTRPLSDAERAELVGLAEHAWREPMPVLEHPMGDYSEVLVTVDGEDAFFLDGFGPMRPPAAKALVDKLKAMTQ